MELTFFEELIYTSNKKLKDGDLEKLDKLSCEYDIFSRINEIFTKDVETIIHFLILDKLPYSIVSKLLFNGEIIKFIKYEDKVYSIENIFGQARIKEHVDRINKLLQYES